MKSRIIALIFLTFLTAAFAVEPVNKTLIGGLAIKGYDTVAYFTDGKPVEGSKEFETTWDGATWRFSSEANLESFESDPEKYAPQYGGYCAWAVSQGTTANIDPKSWTIVDGKLYLNYNEKIQKKWSSNRSALIKKADEEWGKLLPKSAAGSE